MKLSDYLRTLDDAGRTALAAQVSRRGSVGYLYQLAGGHRRASADMAVRLELATKGLVSRAELRPDLWGDVPRPAAPVVAGGVQERQLQMVGSGVPGADS